jgi:hypothetical protein
MKEEQIKARYGNGNPFKTPDGYFESLSDRIMAQIPDNEVVMTRHRKNRTWMYVAAAFCVLLVSGSLLVTYFSTNNSRPTDLAQTQDSLESPTYIEDMVDYALISDAMIYYEYMSDEE